MLLANQIKIRPREHLVEIQYTCQSGSLAYLSLAAVLLASDLLGGDESSLLGLDLGHWLGALVLRSSRIHLRSRVLGDAIDGAVAGHFELKVRTKSESCKS